jgi:hypothetical protein
MANLSWLILFHKRIFLSRIRIPPKQKKPGIEEVPNLPPRHQEF